MPTRSKKFTRSLLTGYGTLAVNILISLASIPIALRYLPGEEFGLWALALQVNGYLALIDFGMSGAVGRFLADHKDEVNGSGYREHFSTGFLVFLIQGAMVAGIGTGLSFFAPSLLAIPSHLAADFRSMLTLLCLISSISIVGRTLSGPLWAFQRMDVINLGGAMGLILQFIVMWLGFYLGLGVMSFVVACGASVLVSILLHAWTTHRNGYLPSQDWFRPRWPAFKEMFAYGRDGMLLSVGSQLVNATQITIINRVLGLNAAASFSIATKLYSMGLLLFHKIIESAAPGLAEMYVRGELGNFVRRYWEAISITLATATIGAVALGGGNSAFVSLWTGGKVSWSVTGDFLLGLMILVTSISRCFMAVFGITKNQKPVRIIYFIEGILFVPAAVLGAYSYGIEGVLVASVTIHILITLSSSTKAASKILGSCTRIYAPILFSTIALVLATVTAALARSFDFPVLLCLAMAIGPVIFSIVIAWTKVIPAETRTNIASRLSPLLAKKIAP